MCTYSRHVDTIKAPPFLAYIPSAEAWQGPYSAGQQNSPWIIIDKYLQCNSDTVLNPTPRPWEDSSQSTLCQKDRLVQSYAVAYQKFINIVILWFFISLLLTVLIPGLFTKYYKKISSYQNPSNRFYCNQHALATTIFPSWYKDNNILQTVLLLFFMKLHEQEFELFTYLTIRAQSQETV